VQQTKVSLGLPISHIFKPVYFVQHMQMYHFYLGALPGDNDQQRSSQQPASQQVSEQEISSQVEQTLSFRDGRLKDEKS